MGNQQSLINALSLLGHNVILTNKNEIIKDIELVILPGVGSFPAGIKVERKRSCKYAYREE